MFFFSVKFFWTCPKSTHAFYCEHKKNTPFLYSLWNEIKKRVKYFNYTFIAIWITIRKKKNPNFFNFVNCASR
jgi:hypothetical protein